MHEVKGVVLIEQNFTPPIGIATSDSRLTLTFPEGDEYRATFSSPCTVTGYDWYRGDAFPTFRFAQNPHEPKWERVKANDKSDVSLAVDGKLEALCLKHL